ncbi:MAG: DUF2851 family protein [Prevotellaceae bacterium]|jgi:hypothetical protein|nr:DUF2851 family protein [Prevotellaceae bacterium]
MNEDFLQFIWKFRLYDISNLKTDSGEEVQVISVGIQNKNSGPDFYDAKIKIGDTVWAGTVEVHKKSSDWIHHGHQNDKAYNNVILHVVEKNDTVIERAGGEALPALEITYPETFKQRYEELCESKHHIPCANYISGVDAFKIKFWLQRLATERLERKTEEINSLIDVTYNDIEEIFHHVLFKHFGFKTNALPFEMLARSISAQILRKYHHSLPLLEALLFGQAGFLGSETEDEYSRNLKSEYEFLQNKHNLVRMDKTLWKYAKLRPGNFPTVRIAQIAALFHKYQNLWETLIRLDDINEVYEFFDVTASEYWENHYVFGKISPARPKKLGKTTIDILIVNVLSPMFFAYSVYKDDDRLREKAIHFLEIAGAESNSAVDEWQRYGIKPCNALESQALLHLSAEYCSKRKCLKCAIGKDVIQNIITHNNSI